MDPRIYREGQRLRSELLGQYLDKYLDEGLRCLIISPDNGAWKYGFQSWKHILDFMGIRTDMTYFLDSKIPYGRYNIFIGAAIKNVLQPEAQKIPFKVGLISKENTHILSDRITPNDLMNIMSAKTFGFNYLLSSFSREMVETSLSEWENALEQEIHTVPFGFDPLIYFPADMQEQHDFFFVGSNSIYKRADTDAYLTPIVSKYEGVLRGTFWNNSQELPPEAARYFYSSARICPNYHLALQRDFLNEVNERTYVISACGGFQLIDNPKILPRFFNGSQMAISKSPEEYMEHFRYYVDKPEERNRMAYNAMTWAYQDEYDLFHRLEPIVESALFHLKSL